VQSAVVGAVKNSPKNYLLTYWTDIYAILQTIDVRAKSYNSKRFEHLLVEISAEFRQAEQKVPPCIYRPLSKDLDFLLSVVSGADTNFKFGRRSPWDSPNMIPENVFEKWVWLQSRDPENFWKLNDNSSKIAKDTNFKFGTRAPRDSPNMTADKCFR